MKNILNIFTRKPPENSPFVAGEIGSVQEALLSRIIDQLPGVIFMKNIQDDYRICLVNREAESFFSFTREQMIGKTDAELFTREEADFFHAIDVQVMNSGAVMDVPCEKITTRQGVMLLHTRKVPIYDEAGHPRYLLGLAQDITERVRNEQELLEYKESLEQKVYERTQKLADAMKKAEEANRLKSEFLATMSHEIRSPMSGVLGMAELLLETSQTVEQANLTKTIINCGEALLNVIEDILDFSKIEANRMEINVVPMNMHELVDDVCTLYSSKAREKALELAVRYVPGTEQFIYADPVRVRQVLSNLINNAIKFTAKGHIAITVSDEPDAAGGDDDLVLKFAVQDTGIGIPVEAQARIFEKFSQGDASTTRDFGGTGLGLSISKRLAEIMGGTISVNSHTNEGSTFTFTLPVKRNTSDVFIQSEPPPLRDTRILIVDDLAIVCQLVEEQLTLAGMRVDIAHSAREALLMMQRAARQGDPYKLALIDYLMPEMNGETLARAISDVPELAETCLIMMTAAGNPIVGDDFARKGFSAYISKPVRNDLLIDMLTYVWTQYQDGKRDVLIRVDTLTFGKDRDQEDELVLSDAHVLLAEDSRINQAFAQEVLENMGCRLTVASNGREAIAALMNDKDISLVLMDCQMPIMDGFEATRKIVQLKNEGILPADLPIVALTANAMEGDRQRCIDAGMDDYLSKPVRRKELKEAVYRWVSDKPAICHEDEEERAGHASAPVVLVDLEANVEARHIFGEKYPQMLGYYKEDVGKYMEEIREALKKRDIAQAIRPAHTIKSNSRGMGAMHLSDLARDMEIKAKAMSEGRMKKSYKDMAGDLEAMAECFAKTIELLAVESNRKTAYQG